MHGNKLFSLYKTCYKNKDSRGIDLFITKNQIESIGGKIAVESEVNVGAEFLVYFKNSINLQTESIKKDLYDIKNRQV